MVGDAATNQNALEIDYWATFGRGDGVLVNHLAGKDRKVSTLTDQNQSLGVRRSGTSYGIGFSGEVDRAPEN